MESLHGAWMWAAVISTGLVGLWGIGLALTKRSPDRRFMVAARVAAGAMLIQVGFGLILYGQGARPGSDYHMFYGFVILFTFAGMYILRAKLERRPALLWGVLLLFVMGLGLRAWANVGG